MHPAFGVRDDEDSEPRLAEAPFVVAGAGEWQVLSHFVGPNGGPLGPKVGFYECCEDARRRRSEFDVAVGQKRLRDRLVEGEPALEGDTEHGDRLELEGAIEVIESQLMSNKCAAYR